MTTLEALNAPTESQSDVPFYAAIAKETDVFRAAAEQGLAVMLKGPTGCGKTRLVEHMAARLGRPLFTVSCHEDMTASDLLGRYVLVGDDTVWTDGPMTRAVREGGICYLDEVVEARQDATVAIHSLTDHRRALNLERHGGETIKAAPGFTLVVSYNPGYQSILKDLKMSTRQRMVAIELDFPPAEIEHDVIRREAGADETTASSLVRLGLAIRRADDAGIREASSTRALVAAARLMAAGLNFVDAATAAVAGPLTDDLELRKRLIAMIVAYDPAA